MKVESSSNYVEGSYALKVNVGETVHELKLHNVGMTVFNDIYNFVNALVSNVEVQAQIEMLENLTSHLDRKHANLFLREDHVKVNSVFTQFKDDPEAGEEITVVIPRNTKYQIKGTDTVTHSSSDYFGKATIMYDNRVCADNRIYFISADDVRR